VHAAHGGPLRYFQGNPVATAEALRLFNSAIELDPDFARAYSHASHCYAHAKTNGWFSGTANEIAETSRLAQQALELGKDDASVLCGSGWARALVVRDIGGGTGLERQQAADAGGHAGLEDEVDNHSLAKAALLSTLLGVGSEVGSGGDNNPCDRLTARASR
jgi:hypothetical protein